MRNMSQLFVKCLLGLPANSIIDSVALRLVNMVLPRLTKSTDVLSLRTRLGWKIGVLPCFDIGVLSLRCSVVQGRFDQQFLRLLSNLVKKGDNVIDIGANEGYVSLHLANKVGPVGHVFSIEPHPGNVAVLSENIKINNWDNVTVIAKAVSDTLKKTTMTFTGSGAWGTLIDCHVKDNPIIVDVERLDDIAADYPRISLIKMDVEGNELRVIRGAQKIIIKDRPIVVFEVNLSLLAFVDISIKETFDFFVQNNYELYKENDGSLETYVWLNERICNIVAVPVECYSRIKNLL